MEFGVSNFGVWHFRFGVLGLKFVVWSFGLKILSLRFRVWGLALVFGVWSVGF